MPGWRVVVTLHTGPGMGLLGARVQLAGENPRGPLGEDRAKSSTRVKKERCQSEKPDPIGLASPRLLEEVSN